MRQRIRATALIFDEDWLLLVREVARPVDWWAPAAEWWTVPGGGLEPGEPLFDGVRREVHEETGLTVEPDRIVYVREFIARRDRDPVHQLEFYVVVNSVSGTLTVPAADIVQEAEFLSRHEIESSLVLPSFLRNNSFWLDKAEGFPLTRYLGAVGPEHD